MPLQVTEKASKKEKLIVRGYARCAYHGDVLDETEKELGSDYELLCLGGGRIKHESKDHSILVYGYSQVSNFFVIYYYQKNNLCLSNRYEDLFYIYLSFLVD